MLLQDIPFIRIINYFQISINTKRIWGDVKRNLNNVIV